MERKEVEKKFKEIFEAEPVIVRSPGINLIGEHTDYNEGFVLPAAIDKAVYSGISKRTDDRIRLYSMQFNEFYEVRISDIKPLKQKWPNYVVGVVHQLLKKGHELPGFNVLVDGDVPLGAGMSSSAALECSVALALNELFQLELSKLNMALIAQAAEHEFAGVKCGIMDQFASVFGRKDHAIKLDCKTFKYEYVPLKMKGIKIVLFDSNVKHSLASSEYNARRQQCEEGLQLIQEYYPYVKSLRDATMQLLKQCITDPVIYKRCKYVLKENARLIAGCEDLRIGDIDAFGLKMYQSHIGLKEEYEVSCDELDYLVNEVRHNNAVLGARMMGGGFGGCTINLVKEAAVEKLIEQISDAYPAAMQRKLTAYIVNVEDGTSLISGPSPSRKLSGEKGEMEQQEQLGRV